MLASLAWGGTCPSGATYTNPSNPTGSLVTLSNMGITSCYYIAASGSDSNDGASEARGHPWAHAPGMPNCTSKCASTTPTGGTGYIFRGGDTWHTGNSGATPYTGGMWLWTWSGSSSSFIYIGVDQTWYSGSSWIRPVLMGDNPTRPCAGSGPCPVSNCTYQTGSNNALVHLSGVRYLTFDNFELTGLCWKNTNPGGTFVWYGGAVAGYQNPFNIQNLYIHGWTYTTAGRQGGGNGFSGYNQNYGVTLQYNVIDGSDSDDLALNPFSQGTDTYIVQYNVIRHAGGTTVSNTCHILHDNLFEYMNNVSDNSTHTDIYMCYGEAGDSSNPGNGTPNLFYNNVFRNIGTEYRNGVSSVLWLFPTAGTTDYVFNNVFHDYYIGNNTNYNNYCEGAANTCGAMLLFNDTEEAGLPNYTGCIICNIRGSVITSVNNHWITNAGSTPSAVFGNTGSVTETTAVYQTINQAKKKGYNSAKDFAPTAASNATVTAKGTNETNSACASFTDPTAVASCKNGTTLGCSYNSINHSVSCPAIGPIARPSNGAWNVGAYQYSATTQPSSHTNLTGTPAPQ
jgi:hypothetical protein